MDKTLERAWNLTPEQREEYAKYLMPAYRKQGGFPLKGAKGIYLEDQDGRMYMDFTSEFFACILVFGNEEIAEVIYEQAKGLTIVAPLHQTDLRYSLCHKIAQIAPENLDRMSFTVGGGPAIESAMKIALKNVPGSRNFVSLQGGYHGTTFGAANATFLTSRLHEWGEANPELFHFAGVLSNNCIRVPRPYPYRSPFSGSEEEMAEYYANMVRDTILNGVPGPTAGVIVEPVQSAGGQIEFSKLYLQKLRKICDEMGTLLIFDEFQTYCRTNRFFAAQYYDVEPDIITFAKGLGGGIPAAGILIHKRLRGFENLMEDMQTFQNNHIAYAAALKTIEIIERDHLLENVETVGAAIKDRLKIMQERYPEIGDIRGPGLAIGVEMVKNPESKEPLSNETMQELFQAAIKQGLFYQLAENVIKLKPPIVITLEEANTAMDMLEASFEAVLRK